MPFDSIPTAADFDRFRVTNPNQSEVVRKRLFDNIIYPTAGLQSVSFFSQPIGQGVTSAIGATAGGLKTQWDTNLELANTLPSGKQFVIESIEIQFTPGSVSTTNTFTIQDITRFAATAAAAQMGAMNDINTVLNSGLVELNILSKNYLRDGPLWCFPSKAGPCYDVAVATNSATTAELSSASGRSSGRPYYLEPPISLQPAVNFEVQVKWPGVVATPSGFNGRLTCILDGFEMRASQ